MKIGVYALARNEAKHVVAWADSCKEADVRVVTDTGSTDLTTDLLYDRDVTVATGYVCPWRWDDAHNLSLNHLPPDVDVCVRLDLDERLQPGWREAIERAWVDNVNNLRYRYVWSWEADGRPGLVFLSDRVHARRGFRWSSATHEGLVCWSGDRVMAVAEGLEIHHHRDAGKKHVTDLELLRVAVREAPHDARARWYLARELDYASMHAEAVEEFRAYLEMPGGSATERSYARRQLCRLTHDEREMHQAAKEAPGEPDAWERLAWLNYGKRQWREVLAFASMAIKAEDAPSHCNDPKALAKAYDLAAVASWELGMRPQALSLAREAVARCPDDPRLTANVEAMTRILGTANELLPATNC